MDQPVEKMGVPFLPPGVEENGRRANSDPVVHAKGRKIWSQLKNSGGFQYFTDIFSWPQYILEEKLGAIGRDQNDELQTKSCKTHKLEGCLEWKSL